MTYDDAYKITNSKSSTNDQRRMTGAYYWLGSAGSSRYLWYVYNYGDMYNDVGFCCCCGVRPVVSLKSGVYIKAGTGTDADPYILGKD